MLRNFYSRFQKKATFQAYLTNPTSKLIHEYENLSLLDSLIVDAVHFETTSSLAPQKQPLAFAKAFYSQYIKPRVEEVMALRLTGKPDKLDSLSLQAKVCALMGSTIASTAKSIAPELSIIAPSSPAYLSAPYSPYPASSVDSSSFSPLITLQPLPSDPFLDLPPLSPPLSLSNTSHTTCGEEDDPFRQFFLEVPQDLLHPILPF